MSTMTIDTVVMEAIDQSICETFQLMLNKEIRQIEAVELLEPTPVYQSGSCDDSALSVVMGWAGDLAGSLTLTMDGKTAMAWTSGLLGAPTDGVDQDVVDAVGELANLVVGSAKSRLTDYSITMTLPVVIHAGLGSMGLQSNTTDLRMTYEFDECQIGILVALCTASVR